MSRKLTVAITMNIEGDPDQSIWYNGGNQHCVFLAMTLARLATVHKLWLTHNAGSGLTNRSRVVPDAFWTNAQHIHTCKGFFAEVYRAPVFELPHL